MSDRPEHLRDLPPLTGEVCTMHLLREHGYVTLVMRRHSGDDLGVFTLHHAEARKLVSRLRELLDGADGGTSLVEGVYVGGPPTAEQSVP